MEHLPQGPEESAGSADELSGVTWWRPGWSDVLAVIGWRWLLLVPGVLLLIVLLGVAAALGSMSFLVAGWKVLALSVGLIVSAAGCILRRAVQARREPFCIFCGYSLTGLPDNYRCPECGRPYSWQEIEEYRRDPEWFIRRWHLRSSIPTPDEPFNAGPVRRRPRDGTG